MIIVHSGTLNVDMLIGLDYFWEILSGRIFRECQTIAIEFTFGLVVGSFPGKEFVSNCEGETDDNVNAVMSRHFSQKRKIERR